MYNKGRVYLLWRLLDMRGLLLRNRRSDKHLLGRIQDLRIRRICRKLLLVVDLLLLWLPWRVRLWLVSIRPWYVWALTTDRILLAGRRFRLYLWLIIVLNIILRLRSLLYWLVSMELWLLRLLRLLGWILWDLLLLCGIRSLLRNFWGLILLL